MTIPNRPDAISINAEMDGISSHHLAWYRQRRRLIAWRSFASLWRYHCKMSWAVIIMSSLVCFG
jgi:hypothetical protein